MNEHVIFINGRMPLCVKGADTAEALAWDDLGTPSSSDDLTTPRKNDPAVAHHLTITAMLEPIWKPTPTQGYTYRTSWHLPDGSLHSLTHRSPEREVCREITKQGYGHARVVFVHCSTGKERMVFRQADAAGKRTVVERDRTGLVIITFRGGGEVGL